MRSQRSHSIAPHPFVEPLAGALGESGAATEHGSEAGSMVEILRPVRQTVPLVISSPHSGQMYPADLVDQSPLDMPTLRSSEDSFVDELFAAGPDLGMPMVRALFPRVYVDPNREPFELDPAMFSDRLPDYVTTRTSRIAAGLGTIAKVVSNSAQVYGGKLTFAEALERLRCCWRPYHDAVSTLISDTVDRFGVCVLLDVHSMPSNVQVVGADGRARGVAEIVIGDCHGTSCARSLSDRLEQAVKGVGYSVERNTPYAGGYVTRHYGRPSDGVHAIQIEVRRDLYMTENRFEKHVGFSRLAEDMERVLETLATYNPDRPWGDAD